MSNMESPVTEHAEYHEPPGWPSTIGILSCIWGGLTLIFNGCCQVGSTAMGYAFLSKMPPEQADQFKNQMAAVGIPGLILMVLQVVLAIILVAAAISLLRRTKAGMTLHLVYAIAGIAIVLFSVVWGIVKADDMAALMTKNPNMQGPMAKFASIGKNGLILVTLVVGFIRLLYPLFCLVWFGKIKRGADLGRKDYSEAI